jgi:hypothetical protein
MVHAEPVVGEVGRSRGQASGGLLVDAVDGLGPPLILAALWPSRGGLSLKLAAFHLGRLVRAEMLDFGYRILSGRAGPDRAARHRVPSRSGATSTDRKAHTTP